MADKSAKKCGKDCIHISQTMEVSHANLRQSEVCPYPAKGTAEVTIDGRKCCLEWRCVVGEPHKLRFTIGTYNFGVDTYRYPNEDSPAHDFGVCWLARYITVMRKRVTSVSTTPCFAGHDPQDGPIPFDISSLVANVSVEAEMPIASEHVVDIAAFLQHVFNLHVEQPPV